MKFSTSTNNYVRSSGNISEPWLIQRCTSQEFKPEFRTSQYLKIDYMGAAEFEWGALPAWQREMFQKLDCLVIRLVEHNGQKLYIMAENHQLDDYSVMIRNLMDGNVKTKMGVRLESRKTRWTEPKRKSERPKPIYDDPSMPYEFDCFWDITNGLAFARDIQVLINLKTTIKNSVKYMNEQEVK